MGKEKSGIPRNKPWFDSEKGKIWSPAAKITNFAIAKNLFDANTILKADADNTPEALTVAEQRIVGRITSGEIASLTASQVWSILASSIVCFEDEVVCNNDEVVYN